MMISSRLVAVSIAAISAGSLVVAGAQVQPPQGQTQGQTQGAGRGNQQPARDAQAQQPAVGTGAISGVIVAEGTGTPVRRARDPERRGDQNAAIGRDQRRGTVRLRRAAAGRYTMTASKAGY